MKWINASAFSCKRNGLKIRGKEFLPGNYKKEQKIPAMIFCHGFHANYLATQTDARYFASKGYATFIFDFNGGGPGSKSQGKQEDMTILTEIEDLITVIRAVRSREYIDENNITVAGQSQGGLAAALTAAKIPDEIQKLLLYYPALNMPERARQGKISSAVFDPNHLPETIPVMKMTLGRKYLEDMMSIDPYRIIGKYQGPVLILQGTEDPVVPPDYAKKAWETYNAGHNHADLIYVPGAKHGFWPNYDKYARFAVESFIYKTSK